MATNNTKLYPGHTLGEFRNIFAFAALKDDGSVVTWGDAYTGGNSSAVASALNGAVDVVEIFSNYRAFAALRSDGSVITWGDLGGPFLGSDSTSVANVLNGTIDVIQIYSTENAFAALLADGSVYTWGFAQIGGNSSSVAKALDGTNDVMQIYSTEGGFAALRADGSVITWGAYGGNSSAVASSLDGTIDVTEIYSSRFTFAALRADGSVVTWGPGHGADSSSVASALDGTIDVKQVYSTRDAFAALRVDGSVVTWGQVYNGGDSSAVADALDGTIDVTQIFSAGYSFAALRADGSVVTWGTGGGDSSAVAGALDGTIDVTEIYSTSSAFAALRADGSVVTWGGGQHGGNSSSVASALNGTIDVIQIYSTSSAFAALRTDGSVITWGNVAYGGNSSSVASQLSSGVVGLSNIYTDESFSATVSPNTLPTADALFELEGVTGGDDGDKSSIGALEAGKIKVMADFSKAAYDLQSWENLSINDSKKYSDEAVTYIENKGWEPVNLTPTLKSLDTYFYIPTLSSITTTNQMQNGFYTNYNAAAFVARSNDAIVISFRGTNDNGQFSSPDVSDWTDKSAHYDLMRPLVEAVESYIVAEGIHKVYVTGHSLGGAMAIKFMNDHANRSFGADYEAITFATASYDLRGTNDPRMTLVEIAGDPVADTGIDNGRNIHFVGDKTIGVSSHFHSMDYYRQMVDSVDNVAWDRILNETGDQSVYIGGQRGISGEEDYFIVDGRLSGVNSVVPNSGNDTLTAPLFANYNIYYGGRGIDKLTGGGAKELMLGGSGNDVLNGMGGNDRLFGDSDNDVLNGGAGADTMVGGSGNDTYVVDNVGDVVAENLNEDTDKVNSNVTYTLSANVENLTLTGTLAINGTGNGMANSITGNAGNNIISGAAGADRLFGKGGKDTLTGGSGADKFIFDTAPGTGNIDTITDFARGIDKIMFDDDIFTTLGITGTLAGVALTADKFHVGASALDALDRIVYNSSTGALYYDANGSGAGAAVQVALIGTSIHPTLSASDFLVIA